MKSSYPPSKHAHFNLVPGNQNTTTKEPMPRPPDMRLVTALASKGGTLPEARPASSASGGDSRATASRRAAFSLEVRARSRQTVAASATVLPSDPQIQQNFQDAVSAVMMYLSSAVGPIEKDQLLFLIDAAGKATKADAALFSVSYTHLTLPTKA